MYMLKTYLKFYLQICSELKKHSFSSRSLGVTNNLNLLSRSSVARVILICNVKKNNAFKLRMYSIISLVSRMMKINANFIVKSESLKWN